MQIIAHRGVMGIVPQNTLQSFEAALKAKVPMIELDTRLTKDKKIIIFHDDAVDHITHGRAHGPIRDFEFDDARKLNVHDGFEDGNFYQIPTLEEVLDLIDNHSGKGYRARLNIELKGANTAAPVAEIVQKYLYKGSQPADFIVSSFRHHELSKFKQLIPEIEIAVLIDDRQWLQMFRSSKRAVALTKKMEAIAINPGTRFVNKKLVDEAHRSGLMVNVWTVKTAKEYRRMSDLGVDGVFVNFLDLDKNKLK
jgi:glycerophosphoryl diester phosphodiesterase